MEVNLNLQSNVKTILESFSESVIQSFGKDLVSIILFGSAAEERMRATSDVNLMVVLQVFSKEKVDPIRERFRIAHAAIQLNVMFILESELELASESFAVKYQDIKNRHKVLFGKDVLSSLQIDKDQIKRRLKQEVLNLTIRLRERYTLISLREEQLALVIANFSGPIRAVAAALMNLKGEKFETPKVALANFVQKFCSPALQPTVQAISEARETEMTTTVRPPELVFNLIEILKTLEKELEKL